MGILDFLPSIISGAGTVFGTVANMINSGLNRKSQSDEQAYQRGLSQQNLDLQRQQLDYQRYLNNNQTQIQAADAQKAGINPLAMSGGSLSSGSFSNVSSASQAPQSEGVGDLLSSGFLQAAQLASTAKQSKDTIDSQEKMHKQDLEDKDKQRKHDLLIKQMELDASDKSSSADRKESARQFDANLAESQRQFNERLTFENEKNNKDYRLALEQFKADVYKYNNSLSSEKANTLLTAKQAFDLIRSAGFTSDYGKIANDIANALHMSKDAVNGMLKDVDQHTDFESWFHKNFPDSKEIILPGDFQ